MAGSACIHSLMLIHVCGLEIIAFYAVESLYALMHMFIFSLFAKQLTRQGSSRVALAMLPGRRGLMVGR